MSWKNLLYGIAITLLLCFMVPFRLNGPDALTEDFKRFITRFNKSYDNDTVYEQKFSVFKDSLTAIDYFNSRRKHNSSALYGLTQYSDMTEEEFSNVYLLPEMYKRLSTKHRKKSSRSTTLHKIELNNLSVPKKVDWRDKGFVTEVYSQGVCGACWAFCVAESIESMYAIKTGKLAKLSVQQLIDCAGYKNAGCKGGDICTLLRWMKDYSVELLTEDEYPLRLNNQTCTMDKSRHGVQIKEFACQSMINHENYILQALSQFGPISVAVNAIPWQHYLGGVIHYHCSGAFNVMNHAVQIVGYDLTAEIPHYIVRNSWGKNFGDNGYLYIAIGENVCGLANEVSILTVV